MNEFEKEENKTDIIRKSEGERQKQTEIMKRGSKVERERKREKGEIYCLRIYKFMEGFSKEFL